jgi:hypothetical protein
VCWALSSCRGPEIPTPGFCFCPFSCVLKLTGTYFRGHTLSIINIHNWSQPEQRFGLLCCTRYGRRSWLVNDMEGSGGQPIAEYIRAECDFSIKLAKSLGSKIDFNYNLFLFARLLFTMRPWWRVCNFCFLNKQANFQILQASWKSTVCNPCV